MSESKAARLLIVEDEEAQRRILADILRKAGYLVEAVGTGAAALEWLAGHPADLVISDWRMPGMDGGELLEEIRRRELACAFIVMTAYGSIAHAVEAIRRGADDYLGKPFERDELLLAARRVLRTRELERENRRLQAEVEARAGFGELLGQSASMQTLYRTLSKVASTDATVLIEGESGTGKELVARTLHTRSGRARGPFVAVNCAAVPETLMESELFGHEKGAFTGAARRREGKFEEAEGGTLFLDEIASMPPALQATLLRVLQEKKFTRLGGRGEVACDARVVAASNRDLGRLVAEGSFREDLYYRLNVVPVAVPALRERREDIPLLARAFLERSARRHGMNVEPMPGSILKRLVEWSWPGNVRELLNVVERLVLLSEAGKLAPEVLPLEIREPGSGAGGGAACPFRLPAEGLSWDAMEAGLLRQALERAGGNRALAAKLLGLGYKAFLYRLEKFALS